MTYPDDVPPLELQWLCRRLDGCEPGKGCKRQVSAALESSLLANSVGVQPNMGVLSKAPQAMFHSAICDVLSKATFGMSATCVRVCFDVDHSACISASTSKRVVALIQMRKSAKSTSGAQYRLIVRKITTDSTNCRSAIPSKCPFTPASPGSAHIVS